MSISQQVNSIFLLSDKYTAEDIDSRGDDYGEGAGLCSFNGWHWLYGSGWILGILSFVKAERSEGNSCELKCS